MAGVNKYERNALSLNLMFDRPRASRSSYGPGSLACLTKLAKSRVAERLGQENPPVAASDQSKIVPSNRATRARFVWDNAGVA